MKNIILGAAGFIGTNLSLALAKEVNNVLTIVDRNYSHIDTLKKLNFTNTHIIQAELTENTDYNELVKGHDIVYHLFSTNVPGTSNQCISMEIRENIMSTINLLEACVHQGVKKIIFLSSGGAVYGKDLKCPLEENMPTNPITSYGIQKITIEKLIYLYNYMYGIDYRIIRLANPYGPFQRPNGVLGAVTTFIYKALKSEEIVVYGDGSVIRDYIYIDDVIRGIKAIVNGRDEHRTFNLGCGYGSSLKNVIEAVERVLNIRLNVKYVEGRMVDVPVNYLNITRYENAYGSLNPISLDKGIEKTASFLRQYYLNNTN